MSNKHHSNPPKPDPGPNQASPGLGRMLLDLSQGHRRMAALLFVLVIAGAMFESAGLSLLLPLLSNIVNVSDSEGSGPFGLLLQLFPQRFHLEVILCLLIVTFFVKSSLLLSYRGLSMRFAMRLRERWSVKLLARYLDAAYMDTISEKQGTLINDIAVEPQHAAKALSMLLELFSKLVLALFLLTVLLVTDWRVTMITMAVGGTLFFFMRKATSRFSLSTGKQRLELNQKITAVAAEGIGGIKEIKLFGMQRRFLQELKQHALQYARVMTRFVVASELPGYTIEFLIIFILSIALAVYHMLEGDLEAILPMLSFFVVVTQRMLVYASNVMALRMRFLSFAPSLGMIHRKIGEGAQARKSRGRKDPGPLCSDIEFQDVTFSYDGETPVFKDLNLRIEHGRMTALVGASGIGKTTIVDLVVGLFAPENGRILINGTSLAEIDEHLWRKQIGYVGQEPLVFNASIRENILAGNPEADESAMIQAAKMANIHDVICTLPKGYDTEVGDKGVLLSGGQRQRLTIARAVIRDPELYIFDEATSALDHESEGLILESIENLSRTKTVLVIAHRITTLRKAHRILELHKYGRLVEREYEDMLRQKTSDNNGLFTNNEGLEPKP